MHHVDLGFALLSICDHLCVCMNVYGFPMVCISYTLTKDALVVMLWHKPMHTYMPTHFDPTGSISKTKKIQQVQYAF